MQWYSVHQTYLNVKFVCNGVSMSSSSAATVNKEQDFWVRVVVLGMSYTLFQELKRLYDDVGEHILLTTFQFSFWFCLFSHSGFGAFTYFMRGFFIQLCFLVLFVSVLDISKTIVLNINYFMNNTLLHFQWGTLIFTLPQFSQ